MRYPEFLKPGGRIGCIAPSFGAGSAGSYYDCFESAAAKMESLGHTIVKGPNVYLEEGIGKSNIPEKCADEINDFFLNDRSDVIISCGGGETMCEDLPYVDFDGIKKSKPKWYMGYSDNTNLTFTLPTLCDTAAIYGPCMGSFGMKEWHPAIQDAYDLICGKKLTMKNYTGWEGESLKNDENPYASYNITQPFNMKILGYGNDFVSFSGRLIGGCLDCLVTLCGTKFDKTVDFCERYKEDGIIWFIESCDLNPMGIRRALWQMDQAGWFKNHVKGFLIGRPLHYGEDLMGMNHINAVTGVLSKYKVPILMDVDLGHLPPMMPLISGAIADVTAEIEELSIRMTLA